jgi:hypothetical protein
MSAAVHQNHNLDCLSTSRSAVQQALGGDLDVQAARDNAYWFITCRRCRLIWYLPKDEHTRTKDAFTILRAHAQECRP